MIKQLVIAPGKPQPLGATVEKSGVNFSLFSQHATSVELLLFASAKAKEPFQIIKLDPTNHRTYHFWHVFVRGLKPGALYTFRVDGPSDPAQGLIYNANKLLIDPYAKSIDYTNWKREDSFNNEPNLTTSPRSIVATNKPYDWGNDKPLNLPLDKTIIYELHVGNFTKSKTAHVKHPGTFSGVIEKIPYLKSLGVTAVELMPIFDFDSGDPKNNWGYGTTGFFAPESSYCNEPDKSKQAKDFRNLVKALHKVGIEVILDVAFGFTTEKGQGGPVLSFKGIDNTIYYLLNPNDKSIYADYSGCKNTLNTNHPIVSKFILDCLEYWVEEMHVDGFRLDEAALLSRDENGNLSPHPHTIWNISLSEKLANTKFFAEPWDAMGGYLVGKFPGFRFVEWNDRFRNDIRRFVRGEFGLIQTLADRLTGSSDIYEESGRRAINTLNFITSHDGFTLNDLVSYSHKHNEDNGENNLDGLDENYSANYGVEGPTDDREINALRQKQMRNLLTLLFLSRGVPMLTMGDEAARTQKGNNNAYCQDNEISWFNWQLVSKNADLLQFTQALINFRKEFKLFNDKDKPTDFIFHGCQLHAPGFQDPNSRVLSYTFKNKIHAVINMDDADLPFELPKLASRDWYLMFDTADPKQLPKKEKNKIIKGENVRVTAKSIIILAAK